jgi:hypothetical protein
MKILYIAGHRRAAEDAASALRHVAPDAGVVWAASYGGARLWIDKNRHVSTLIIEVDADDPGAESFITQIRALGVTAPVIVASVKDPAPPLVALKAAADQVVTKDRSFLSNLPHLVTRLLNAPRPEPRRRLFAEAVAAAERLSRPGPAGETGAARTVVERDALAQLNDTLAAIAHVRPDREPEPATPAAEPPIGHVAQPVAAVPVSAPVPAPVVGPSREQLAREHLERRLAEASAALRDADARAAAEQQSAWKEASARHTAIAAEFAREIATRRALEQALAAATAARDRAEARLASETTAAAAIDTLQVQLSESLAALHRADQQAAADRHAAQTAVERAATFDTALAREVNAREELARALADAESARRLAEQRHASETEIAAALRADHQRLAETHRAAAAAAAATIETLQSELADAITALTRVEEAAATERVAMMEAAERQIDLDARLADETAQREALASQLADAQAALRLAEERHASELADAHARLAEAQRRIDGYAAETAAALDDLRAKLVESADALQRAEQQAAADRQAAAEDASQRRVKFTSELTQERARRQLLEQQLTAADGARQRAEEQHAADLAAAVARLTDARTEVETRLAETQAAVGRLETQLAERTAALERAAAEQQTASAEAAARQREFDATLARADASREALERTLADQRAAEERTREVHAADLAAAVARLAEAQRQADSRLMDAQGALSALEIQLAERTAALDQAIEQASAERQAAAAEAIERQREFDAALARADASREALERTLAAQHVAEQRTRDAHAAELAAAAARLAEYEHHAEQQMAQAAADAAAALQIVEDQAAADRQAAATQAAERQAAFDADRQQAVAQREALEDELTRVRAASGQAERRFLDQVAEMRQRAHEHETRLEERAARARGEWEAALAERDARAQQVEIERDLARQSLAESEVQSARLASRLHDERATLEQARMALESNLARERAAHAALHAVLEKTQATAAEILDRASRDHATEQARLEALVAERDARLQEQAAGHQVATTAAAEALAGVEGQLKDALTARDENARSITALKGQLASVTASLESTTREREALKTESDKVPQLLAKVDDLRRARHRHFADSPLNLCRCRPDGSIIRVNRSLASLLGYDTPEALLAVDFAADVFESGAELPWIVDRRLRSGSTESVDTTWRKKDRTRIIVRLRVVATSDDSIELAAEDITAIRSLEERLRNAQRMEAVARYASEVAATCDTLLRDIRQEAEEWLSTLSSGAPRYHGELLLDEVERASSLLRQLSVYGQQQKNAADLVNVPTVLRDIEPVLKRVAGGRIDLVLPETSMPLHVDLEAERLERILVNVAAYARGRMASSGRLIFDVASVMMDRDFFEKYPNVRPGPHVLLTVTEKRGTPPPDLAALDQPPAADASSSVTNRTGVDLGTLQTLVTECGGHLWMTMDPLGDMVLKIHLPRRVLDALDPPPAAKPGRTRWIDRLAGVRR